MSPVVIRHAKDHSMLRNALLLSIVLLSSLMLAKTAAAQTEGGDKPPLPPGPIVAKLPANAQWQIVFTDAEGRPLPPAAPGLTGNLPPRQITITRTRPIWHSEMIDTGGRTAECWYDGGIHFARMSNETTFTTVTGAALGLDPLLVAYDSRDFPKVDWVSPGTYRGIQQVDGRSCFVFSNGGSTVWIDQDTHYPVRGKEGDRGWQVQILAPPAGMLSLPAKLAGVSAAMQRMRQVGSLQSRQ
jgi:hypothetical protein